METYGERLGFAAAQGGAGRPSGAALYRGLATGEESSEASALGGLGGRGDGGVSEEDFVARGRARPGELWGMTGARRRREEQRRRERGRGQGRGRGRGKG